MQPVPYQAGIDARFMPGKRLFVSGIPDEKVKRFAINLLAPNGDIPFMVNPRFDDKVMRVAAPLKFASDLTNICR